MPKAILQIRSGPLAGQLLTVPDKGAILGRGSESTFPLHQYEAMSRKHARIYQQDGSWMIEDLKSTNGVLVDGLPVTVSALSSSSTIDVGGLEALFVIEKDANEISSKPKNHSSNTTYLHKLLEAHKATSRQLKQALAVAFIALFASTIYTLLPRPSPLVLSAPVEERVRSGVVLIACINGTSPDADAIGTGFLISDQYVLTNRHVVTNEESVPAGGSEQTVNCMITFFSGSGHEVSIQVPATNICTFTPANNNDTGQFDTDLALIRLPQPAPTGATPLIIGHTSSVGPSDRVFMEGFPEGGGVDFKENGNIFKHLQVNGDGYPVFSPYPDPENQPHDINELERDDNQHIIAVHMSGSGVAGDSGSPVVDANGNVIAIHRGSNATGTILKVEIPTDFIRAFLFKAEPLLQGDKT